MHSCAVVGACVALSVIAIVVLPMMPLRRESPPSTAELFVYSEGDEHATAAYRIDVPADTTVDMYRRADHVVVVRVIDGRAQDYGASVRKAVAREQHAVYSDQPIVVCVRGREACWHVKTSLVNAGGIMLRPA